MATRTANEGTVTSGYYSNMLNMDKKASGDIYLSRGEKSSKLLPLTTEASQATPANHILL